MTLPRAVRATASLAAALALAAACAHAPEPAADAVPEPPQANAGDACGATPVAQEHAGERFGALTFAGGLELQARREDFGGLSGLMVANVNDNGDTLAAIGDRGFLARLETTIEDGRLTGVTCGYEPLRDLDGERLADGLRDAEGLTALADGTWAISFERAHRIAYLAPGAAQIDRPGPRLGDVSGLDNNLGLEALSVLASGAVIAGAESPTVLARPHPVWRFEATGDAVAPLADADGPAFSIAAEPGFGLVGLETTPRGDLIVLERFWTRQTGNRIKLSWLSREAVENAAPGETLRPVTLARWGRGDALPVDNFEGVATAAGADGITRVWIVSDDNFNPAQRALLYLFAFDEDAFAEPRS